MDSMFHEDIKLEVSFHRLDLVFELFDLRVPINFPNKKIGAFRHLTLSQLASISRLPPMRELRLEIPLFPSNFQLQPLVRKLRNLCCCVSCTLNSRHYLPHYSMNQDRY